MKTEIKKRIPMVWVEVAFWTKTERLIFEWTEETLKKAMQFDFVYFRNLQRNVLTTKIKDFWPLEDENIKNREIKMSSLTEEQKEKVKEFIGNMKRNIWREPTDSEFDKMIFVAVNGRKVEEKFQPLSSEKRRKTIEIIQKMREHKAKFWTYNLKNFWKVN